MTSHAVSNDAVQLEKPEVDCIVELVKIRLLAAAVIAHAQKSRGVAVTETIAGYGMPALAAIERLTGHEQDLRSECRRGTGLTTFSTSKILERRMAAMGAKAAAVLFAALAHAEGAGRMAGS